MAGCIPVIVVVELEALAGARGARDEKRVEVDHLVTLRTGLLDDGAPHQAEKGALPGLRGLRVAKAIKREQHALRRQADTLRNIAQESIDRAERIGDALLVGRGVGDAGVTRLRIRRLAEDHLAKPADREQPVLDAEIDDEIARKRRGAGKRS